jgi:hypothetical protein
MMLRTVLALSTALLFAGGASAAPARQTIRLTGTWDPIIAPDLARVFGNFSARGKFCSGGSFENQQDGTPDFLKSFTRTFTCADGRGSITVHGEGTREDRRGGKGTWRIASGTGPYARLRGRGTWRTIAAGVIDFNSNWTGVTDFDTAPPRLRIVRADSVAQAGRYTVTLVLRARDNVSANAVAYTVTAFVGQRPLARREGTTRSGRVTVRLVVRTTRAVPAIRLVLEAHDPLGNRALVTRRVALTPD